MSATPNINELFERTVDYPNANAKERLDSLVGLDKHKSRLSKILGLLVNPESLEDWARKHHTTGIQKIISTVLRRPPLVVLEGDVGSGKSELAETIGDAVARMQKIDICLLPLSLSSRGQGLVGEMTRLISAAFEHTISEAEKLKANADGKHANGGIILLVDEADALAQSREAAQMHHEDKAGVNAFIRGIDRIVNAKIPAAVIMCTNRINALDPAIKRRAADILRFERPDEAQREQVLSQPLKELEFSDTQIKELVKMTGTSEGREYGFTFSDLMQRLIPAIVLAAYPHNPVTYKGALAVAKTITPTPPFQEQQTL